MMQIRAHSILWIFLSLLVVTAAGGIWLRNSDYYLLSLDQRPFHTRYDQLKPSGIEGHAYGIAGTVLIIIGVASYSSRKRIRRFHATGTMRHFLQFHIVVCLFGPILIVYHTTFKFGGLVGISFWSMMAVVASGLVGRFIYRFIPRSIEGNELTVQEIEGELGTVQQVLAHRYGMDEEKVDALERQVLPSHNYTDISSGRLLLWLFVSDLRGLFYKRKLHQRLLVSGIAQKDIGEVTSLTARRMILHQRMAFLSRMQTLFYYWHVVHIPFTITLFAILAIHIGVAIAFGYTWIW
jgi:hypothetical protein